MNAAKKLLGALSLVCSLTVVNSAHAGIPVIDASSLAQQIQQVAAWSQQYKQMADQIKNLSGIRNMGNLANNPSSRQYLPAEYQTILNNGVGQWKSIYDAAKTFDISTSTLSSTSDSAKAFQQIAKQAAINRASAEEAYRTASQRFTDIQTLLDKVNDAPEAKDIADLQGRIQAEQVMMQNEANKLAMLQQLALAQRDLAMQQAAERRMKATRGEMPNW